MAYGRDVDKWPTTNQPQRVEGSEEDYEEPDRFEECKKNIHLLLSLFCRF